MKNLTLTTSFVWSRLILLSATVSLASCATPAPYKAVEGPDVAKIRLRNATGKLVLALESHKGDCTDMTFFGGGTAGIPSGGANVTTVAPGAFYVMNVFANGNSAHTISSCGFVVGFVAEPRGNYEVIYSQTPKGCNLRATVETAAGIEQVPLAKMQMKNMFGPQSCVPAKN